MQVIYRTEKRFTDIAPELPSGEYYQFDIPRDIIKFVVNHAQSHRTKTCDLNRKAVYNALTEKAGMELVCVEVVKLAATLALLCRKLAGGNKKRMVRSYVNYLICVGAFHYGKNGRELLAVVRSRIQNDIAGRMNPRISRH